MQPYADRVASRIGWEHCDRARPGRRPCGETGRHKRILSQRLNPPLRVPFGPTRPEVLPCRTTPAGGCTRGEASAQMLTRTATRNMGRLAIGVAWGLQAADAQLPRTESGQGSGISAAFRDCGPDRVGGSCSSSANAGIVEVAGLSVTVAHYGAGLTAGPLDGSVPGPGPAKCDEAGVFVCARARARATRFRRRRHARCGDDPRTDPVSVYPDGRLGERFAGREHGAAVAWPEMGRFRVGFSDSRGEQMHIAAPSQPFATSRRKAGRLRQAALVPSREGFTPEQRESSPSLQSRRGRQPRQVGWSQPPTGSLGKSPARVGKARRLGRAPRPRPQAPSASPTSQR